MSPKLFIIIFLTFISLTSNLFSQETGPQKYRIASIDTKGNKNYEKGTIISYSGLRQGAEISLPSDETRDAISRLWNIGIFSDVKIFVEKKFGDEVYLVIEVEELPRVESLEITGNDELSEDELKEKINIVPGEVISEQKLKDIEYNLEKAYAEEGFGMAEVSVDKLLSANNEARIRIKIKEGNELTVNRIIVKGNKNVSKEDLIDAFEKYNSVTKEDVKETVKNLLIDKKNFTLTYLPAEKSLRKKNKK